MEVAPGGGKRPGGRAPSRRGQARRWAAAPVAAARAPVSTPQQPRREQAPAKRGAMRARLHGPQMLCGVLQRGRAARQQGGPKYVFRPRRQLLFYKQRSCPVLLRQVGVRGGAPR